MTITGEDCPGQLEPCAALDDDCLTNSRLPHRNCQTTNSSDNLAALAETSRIVASVGPSNFGASNAMPETPIANQQLDRRISVAPMMDWTDEVHFDFWFN